MSKPKYNKSKTFLLPLIAPLIGIEEKYFNLIENTWLFDSENKHVDCIIIEQDFSFKNPEFTAYEHKLTDNQYFVELHDSDERVLYVFKFPEEYLVEYYLLLNSKYSEFGKDAKSQILDFWTTLYGKSTTGINFILKQKQILYKEKILKEKLEEQFNVKLDDDAELGDFVEIEHETININEYKNKKATP